MARRSSKTSAQDEVVALRRQLEEAQDALRAIRFGEVDALVIETGKAPQVFTLETADRPYRLFVEWMQQGAVTVRQNGRISYCNRSFSDLVGCPHERVVGSPFSAFVAPEGQDVLTALLDHALSSGSQGEVLLQAVDGAIIPAYITINSLPIGDVPARCIIVTDLSDQKRFQALSVNERLSRTILEQAVDAVIVRSERYDHSRFSDGAHTMSGQSALAGVREDVPLDRRRCRHHRVRAPRTTQIRDLVGAGAQRTDRFGSGSLLASGRSVPRTFSPQCGPAAR